MHFVVSLVGTIAVSDDQGNTPPNIGALLEDHLTDVMDRLIEINATDPDIELDLTNCGVRLAILVDADDPDKAVAQASPIVRSAIHAAGGSTPEWPDANNNAWSVDQVTLSVRAVDLVSA